MRTATLLLLASSLATALPAQIGPDSQDQIRRIAEKVAEEMKEIDRLLNSRDPSSSASDAARRAADGIQKMLEQAETTNKRVQQGIEELLEQMKSQEGGQGQGEQQDQQQQQGQRREQNSPREENQTPDMVQQQQQQQPGQQQQGQQGQPRDPGQNPQQAENRPAQQPPGEDGKEVVERAGETASWGNLPEYLGAIKQRGGVPEVSEKYRKLYDAYLKAQAKKPAAPQSGR